jgi:hypothetical protein
VLCAPPLNLFGSVRPEPTREERNSAQEQEKQTCETSIRSSPSNLT